MLKHIGKSAHRLRDNPLERAYQMAWIRENQGNLCGGVGVLQWLLGDNNRPATDLTERDALVAATVIQWLGSPVGQNFVNSVLNSGEDHSKKCYYNADGMLCNPNGTRSIFDDVDE